MDESPRVQQRKQEVQMRAAAEKLINNGIAIIPLFKNEKKNGDKDILTRDYSLLDLLPDGNLGINLKKSKLYCVDLDSDEAIYFGNKWLPNNTRIHGRINEGVKQQTHFYFKSDDSIPENIKNRGVVDFLIDHNVVALGKTKNKHTKLLMERYIAKDDVLCTFNQHIFDTYNKVCFAAAITPHIKKLNADNMALKLDACLFRYTKWNDDQRLEFLLDVYKKAMPNSKDVKASEFKRKIKSNNKKIKNAGYNALAAALEIKPTQMKTWLGWIGDLPQDKDYEGVKSYHNFVDTRVDMPNLMTSVLPEINWAVKDILPEGLVLWCGRPKAMKSWTALKAAYAVQNGGEFLGKETVEGDVLYAALEDNKRRLQDRIKKLDCSNKKHPDIILEAPYLAMGLEESIKSWIDKKDNPKLVIIDTLSRVKRLTNNKSATAFDLDNALLKDLQKLAIENRICIVLISHLGKADRDYSWDKIQGSVGMQGMTDAMWMIDRGDVSDKASIVGRGRDIHDFAFAVSWSSFCWSYQIEGDLGLIRAAENKKEIYHAMNELSKGGQKEFYPRDISKYYAFSAQSKDAARIQKTMQRMKERNELDEGSKFGQYVFEKAYEAAGSFYNLDKINFETDKGKGFDNVKK